MAPPAPGSHSASPSLHVIGDIAFTQTGDGVVVTPSPTPTGPNLEVYPDKGGVCGT